MAIVSLPLPPGPEARLLLRRLLDEVNILGRDAAGRTIIQFAVDDWALDRLMAFDAGAAHPHDAAGGPVPDEELVPTPVCGPPDGDAGEPSPRAVPELALPLADRATNFGGRRLLTRRASEDQRAPGREP